MAKIALWSRVLEDGSKTGLPHKALSKVRENSDSAEPSNFKGDETGASF